MEELTDGVYAFTETIETEEGERAFHPAAVETERGLLLLDAGLPGQAEALGAEIEAAGFGWGDVWAVLITHQDGDHAGALATVREKTDAVVFAHEACAPYVDGRDEPIKGDGERYPPTPVDVELVGEETFGTTAGPMRVVYTPGHAPGHVSLYLPEERLLLAADALTAADGELQGPSEQFSLDMAEAGQSVARLASLAVEGVLCYHGGFSRADDDRIAAIGESIES
ncbi:beta-lactamase domain-containing protein [Halosimplex carlsbadense 2-9-1]|uniref:Beta-lactamase domain-containing protein n=1 Tax=Halosimplex carlsbadense 2-9-1 TaxID=797114 RepID=M0CZW2_9EURY|nr:MBL fold metallo-hydrolase [Halosimplex carlsbadense]ELZ28786.1 beta-lactamase domain-containing protein [Halosimplex carlsbadense 2-9-1]